MSTPRAKKQVNRQIRLTEKSYKALKEVSLKAGVKMTDAIDVLIAGHHKGGTGRFGRMLQLWLNGQDLHAMASIARGREFYVNKKCKEQDHPNAPESGMCGACAVTVFMFMQTALWRQIVRELKLEDREENW
jgi:hypothetical protein